MQLISPFLHAHTFGLGAVNNAPGIHIHIDEIDSAAKPDFDKATIHNEAIPEHSIVMFTGVSEKFEFQLLIPIVFAFLSLSLYLAYVRRFYTPASAPFIKTPDSRSPSPRAPPAHH
jgi:hypothetical protein